MAGLHSLIVGPAITIRSLFAVQQICAAALRWLKRVHVIAKAPQTVSRRGAVELPLQ
jgi:hypothetical protein